MMLPRIQSCALSLDSSDRLCANLKTELESHITPGLVTDYEQSVEEQVQSGLFSSSAAIQATSFCHLTPHLRVTTSMLIT
jgi:hypothetical protein